MALTNEQRQALVFAMDFEFMRLMVAIIAKGLGMEGLGPPEPVNGETIQALGKQFGYDLDRDDVNYCVTAMANVRRRWNDAFQAAGE